METRMINGRAYPIVDSRAAATKAADKPAAGAADLKTPAAGAVPPATATPKPARPEAYGSKRKPAGPVDPTPPKPAQPKETK